MPDTEPVPSSPPPGPNPEESGSQRLERFTDLVLEGNQRLNLTAPCDRDTLWRRHIGDSLAGLFFLDAGAPPATRVIDVGSGAGLPGLALACARPALQVLSVEATGRKARFQAEAARTLGLDNFRVVDARAEAIGRDPRRRGASDVAMARAVAPLATLVELLAPLVAEGGAALAWKGREARREIDEAAQALEILGMRVEKILTYAPPEAPGEWPRLAGGDRPEDEDAAPTLVVLRKVAPTPDQYPRRDGVPARRPLGLRGGRRGRSKKEN